MIIRSIVLLILLVFILRRLWLVHRARGTRSFAHFLLTRTKQRSSRWRPVCPECGYLIRGLTSPRCPECGVDFPTPERTFRRWAFRRIPWDRLDRGSLLLSYLKTLGMIVFTPWRASRGLAIPDHRWRSYRWAVVHLLLAAVVCSLLGNDIWWHWVVQKLYPPPPGSTVVTLSSLREAWDWFWQPVSFAAWVVRIVIPVLLAIIINNAIPGRHPAAKYAGIKWTLYLVGIFPLLIGLWWGFRLLVEPDRMKYGVAIPAMYLALVFGLWWAAGIAAIPYNRYRGTRVFIGCAVLFFLSWFLVTNVLFPPGPLEHVI